MVEGTVRYNIKIHRKVIKEDARQFDERTKEKIKNKCKELLSIAPEKAGESLHFELKDYCKSAIFDHYRIIYRIRKKEVLVYVLNVGIRRDSGVYKQAVKRLHKWVLCYVLFSPLDQNK